MTAVQTAKPPAVIQLHSIHWQGIEIELRYCRSWSESFERLYGHPLAHLEIETIRPEREPLPFTETGYRSHFGPAHDIEAAGGPEAFVQTCSTGPGTPRNGKRALHPGGRWSFSSPTAKRDRAGLFALLWKPVTMKEGV